MNNHNHIYQTHGVTTPAEPLLPLTNNEGREHLLRQRENKAPSLVHSCIRAGAMLFQPPNIHAGAR